MGSLVVKIELVILKLWRMFLDTVEL